MAVSSDLSEHLLAAHPQEDGGRGGARARVCNTDEIRVRVRYQKSDRCYWYYSLPLLVTATSVFHLL